LEAVISDLDWKGIRQQLRAIPARPATLDELTNGTPGRICLADRGILPDYYITRIIKQLADELCGGRTVFCLEGGYNLTVLSCAVNATFNIWLGDNYFEDPLGLPPDTIRPHGVNELIVEVKKRHGLY